LIVSLISGKQQDLSKDLKSVLNLLRMFRLLRVLRLVRLLRAIKPLYNLLLGVMESLRAMQWVMVLTLLTLYAGAITWTSLVGKDMLPPPMKGNGTNETVDQELQEEAHQYFGSVANSLFSLFKLMNGDTAVVASVTHTVYGQLLFAGFMILSNWAVLAILTSVVSDNMISTSAKAAEEDAKERSTRERTARLTRLSSIFKEVDKGGNQEIDEAEWRGLLENEVLRDDLCDATGLNIKSLQEMFDCASHGGSHANGEHNSMTPSKVLSYDSFMDALEDETATADKRSVRNVILHLHGLEGMIRHIYEDMAEIRQSMNTADRSPPRSCRTPARLPSFPQDSSAPSPGSNHSVAPHGMSHGSAIQLEPL